MTRGCKGFQFQASNPDLLTTFQRMCSAGHGLVVSPIDRKLCIVAEMGTGPGCSFSNIRRVCCRSCPGQSTDVTVASRVVPVLVRAEHGLQRKPAELGVGALGQQLRALHHGCGIAGVDEAAGQAAEALGSGVDRASGAVDNEVGKVVGHAGHRVHETRSPRPQGELGPEVSKSAVIGPPRKTTLHETLDGHMQLAYSKRVCILNYVSKVLRGWHQEQVQNQSRHLQDKQQQAQDYHVYQENQREHHPQAPLKACTAWWTSRWQPWCKGSPLHAGEVKEWAP
mmetsp:Transcript_21305/g.61568  ORF Transcript_21305/g.61568 Transcript_21305/m.61568 type:complete len:282 (+) Transcript_21305:778-1623(+)